MSKTYTLKNDKPSSQRRDVLTPQMILSTYYVTSNGSRILESNWSQWDQWSNWDQWRNWPHGR